MLLKDIIKKFKVRLQEDGDIVFMDMGGRYYIVDRREKMDYKNINYSEGQIVLAWVVKERDKYGFIRLSVDGYELVDWFKLQNVDTAYGKYTYDKQKVNLTVNDITPNKELTTDAFFMVRDIKKNDIVYNALTHNRKRAYRLRNQRKRKVINSLKLLFPFDYNKKIVGGFIDRLVISDYILNKFKDVVYNNNETINVNN